jgi:hypothetical protein
MDVTEHKNAMHDKETMAKGASHATITLGEVLHTNCMTTHILRVAGACNFG